MMETIKVEIKEKKEYDIFLGSSILTELAEYIKKNQSNKKIVIISDDNIKNLYEKNILEVLKDLNPHLIAIPPGESSKSRETKQKIEDELLDKKFGRDTVIIAFGGGVIGDLAGFVASTFERGIPVIQVPTTLLAMVDSSIGGKTGINTKHGKNLIGTIWQPDAVFADMDFLEKLPQNEFLNGLAEAIKMAIILDKDFFGFIEENYKKIMEKDKKTFTHLIKRGVEIKRDIVNKDPYEAGLRQILNFGHTIGHAVEAYSDFSMKHGFCVAIGMAVEIRIAVLLGELDTSEEKRIVSLLKWIGLPTNINKEFEKEKLIEFMMLDKKARKKKPRFVILKEIGKVKEENDNFSFEINEEVIEKAIESSKNETPHLKR